MSKDELDLLVDAARSDVPDDSQAFGAQTRLQRVLTHPKKEKKRMSTFLFFAGARTALTSFAAILTLGAGFFVGFNPTGPSLAFAAVLEQVRDLDTYRSKITVETAGAEIVSIDMAFQAPGKMHMALNEGMDMIIDTENKRMMTLMHDGQMAMLMDIPDDDDDDLHFDNDYGRYMMIERLKDYQGDAREVLPEEEINGKWCTGYVIDLEDDVEMTLWVETDTQLPIKAVAVGGLDLPSLRVVIDMDYDQEILDDLFLMEAPEGYKLMNIGLSGADIDL